MQRTAITLLALLLTVVAAAAVADADFEHDDLDDVLALQEEPEAVTSDVEAEKTVKKAAKPVVAAMPEIGRCASVVGMLEKRDQKEDNRIRAELAMVEMVRTQLQKLNAVGLLQIKKNDVADLLAQVDLDRDYKEVNGPNGIFSLLEGLEKRLRANLKTIMAETKGKRDHCVSICSEQIKLQKASLLQAKRAVRKARYELRSVSKRLAMAEGEYRAQLKHYRETKAHHERMTKTWNNELMLIDVLRRKAVLLRNVKAQQQQVTDEAADVEVSEDDFTEMIGDVETGGVSSQFTTVLNEMKRPHASVLKIQKFLDALKVKVLKEQKDSEENLAKQKAELEKRHALVQKLRVEKAMAQRKLAAAVAVKKSWEAKLAKSYRQCRRFV